MFAVLLGTPDMPNDAKLGLVVGVGLVMTVAVIFFRKDLITRKPTAEAAASTVSAGRQGTLTAPRATTRSSGARTASRTDQTESGEVRERE